MEETTEKEPSEVITPDTPNATYFKPSEGSNPEKFKRFRSYNRGTWKDRREEDKRVTHRQDNLAIFDAISTQVELNSYQKQEARRTFDNLDLQRIGRQARLVAFCVCAVVANDDVHDGHRYWPTANNTDDAFERLAEALGFRDNQILSVMGKVDSRRSQ